MRWIVRFVPVNLLVYSVCIPTYRSDGYQVAVGDSPVGPFPGYHQKPLCMTRKGLCDCCILMMMEGSFSCI